VTEERRRKEVREGYARIALDSGSCCSGSSTQEESRRMGYTKSDLRTAPAAANMGLGCGNPVALASLKEAEVVIDLGSGGGLDCFLAAKKVGPRGRVIGVDMTPEMVDKARENARRGKYVNVEFRLGEIENLPVADNTADVVISNCVINLTPDKRRVFEEAFRVLRPGGRLMVSDLVLSKELPETVKKGVSSASCITGAILKDRYMETIAEAGFENVRVQQEKQYRPDGSEDNPSAEVLTFNPKTNVTESRKVSELDVDTRRRVKRMWEAVLDIDVSAMKPPGKP
jgi:SAM-dependent methyltransferase